MTSTPSRLPSCARGRRTPIAHFTTFLTYQEPGAIGEGGPLRVGVVLPVSNRGATTVASALTEHRDVPTTLAISPAGVEQMDRTASKGTAHALEQLGSLEGDQVLAQPYVPVDVAALSEAGITDEIGAQMVRGDEVLHAAGLRPSGGPWVDTASSFAQGDAGDLSTGLQQTGASQLVLSDGDLSTTGLSNYTFAQPFTLDLGHGSGVTGGGGQLRSLRPVHRQTRPTPSSAPSSSWRGCSSCTSRTRSSPTPAAWSSAAGRWRPSTAFLDTLLGGLAPGNPALSAVTLGQLFAQVPPGGAPVTASPRCGTFRPGPPRGASRTAAADKIAQARQQLSSYADAIHGHPPEVVALSDALLATEARALSPVGRTAALTAYQRGFVAQTGKISLATEQTVTFTAQQASIPITVLSAAPYPVNVVVTLTSDKFTFPDGNTRPLLLDRPTTSVRVTAQARTSGDRLPIDVSLHTQNGQLLLARTVLTVHSTAISFVGVALTVLAGAVLLVWWGRTWRRSRRQRPRAH